MFEIRLALILLFLAVPPLDAQQRPLITEDPRLIPEGHLVTETGFGYFTRAQFPVNGIKGNLLSILDGGFHFGLGSRAEFQITGTLRNYLWVKEGGIGQRNDWGDGLLSTKIAILKESTNLLDLTFRPTIVLPNSSDESIGKDGTDFFGSLLIGKSVGSTYIFGNIGLGILDDAVRVKAQQDVLTYGIAIITPVTNSLNLSMELNGLENPQSNPTLGGEDRAQGRFGVQFNTLGMRWDIGLTAGLRELDHRIGIVFGFTRQMELW